MIHSMTAFGSARTESEPGSLSVEFRSVNSRFLDITIRMPDELRFAESVVREQISRFVVRGKVEARVSYVQSVDDAASQIDPVRLEQMARQLDIARQAIPDVIAPRLTDLFSTQPERNNLELEAETWTEMCRQACEQALEQLQAARQREGQRLAETMLATGQDMAAILDQVEQNLPALMQAWQERITTRLRETLEAVSPDGFSQISGEELSARIAQEASLFSMRSDIAEELSRLRSHVQELQHLLSGSTSGAGTAPAGKRQKGSAGKRLDFLCQEMNREANTIGSKAASLDITHAAIDLKLFIEQLREQAQNIE